MPAVETTPPGRSRRDLLCGLLVAVVAPGALVAGCGDDSPAGGGGGGSVDVALADIPDGGGLIVDSPAGGKALVVRDGQQVRAYNASCTHMGTIIAAPVNGVSTCPNHGSQFDAETGEAVHGPATQPLGKLTATVRGDLVVLS